MITIMIDDGYKYVGNMYNVETPLLFNDLRLLMVRLLFFYIFLEETFDIKIIENST